MHRKLALALTVSAAFALGMALVIHETDAARNASGTYSRTAGQPVTSGTTITASAFNTLTADLATEMTDSLSRSGKGAMLAPLELVNGSTSAPSLSWDSDTNTGLYWVSADRFDAVCGATTVASWRTTGVTFPVGVIVTQSQANTVALAVTGNGTGSAITGTGATSATAIGVLGTSGTSGGQGVKGVGAGGNAQGIRGEGQGSGAGISGVGGATGAGVSGTGGGTVAGGSFANGTAAIAGTARSAVELTNGYLGFVGVTSPQSTLSVSDTLTPANVPKAWGIVNGNGGTNTLLDGFNVTGVAVATDPEDVAVTLGADCATGNYAVTVTGGDGYACGAYNLLGGSFDFGCYSVSTDVQSEINIDGSSANYSFVVFCRQ